MTVLSCLRRGSDTFFFLASRDVPNDHFLVQCRHGEQSAIYLLRKTKIIESSQVVARVELNAQRRVWIGGSLAGSNKGMYLYRARHVYRSQSQLWARLAELALERYPVAA